MSEVSKYILSIAGIILISIMVEFVINEGSISKYVKGILSFFVIAVIILPLPKLINSGDLSSIFEFESYDIQENFIYKNSLLKIDELEKEIISEYEENGYTNLDIEIQCENLLSETFKVSKVIVNISYLTFSNDAKCQNVEEYKIYSNDYLKEKLNIREENIIYES